MSDDNRGPGPWAKIAIKTAFLIGAALLLWKCSQRYEDTSSSSPPAEHR